MITPTPRESIPRTMFIAVCVALFCSAMVSGAVFLLRPMQAAYAALERARERFRAELDVVLESADMIASPCMHAPPLRWEEEDA